VERRPRLGLLDHRVCGLWGVCVKCVHDARCHFRGGHGPPSSTQGGHGSRTAQDFHRPTRQDGHDGHNGSSPSRSSGSTRPTGHSRPARPAAPLDDQPMPKTTPFATDAAAGEPAAKLSFCRKS
jgi:hypothetical protein